MATALGIFSVGPHTQSVILQPNSGTLPTLTPGSTYDITALVLSARPTNDRSTENIKPSTNIMKNSVVTETGSGGTLQLLQTSDANDTLLRQMLDTTYQVLLTITKTLFPTGTQVDTGWYTISRVAPGLDGIGRQTIDVTLEPYAVTGGQRTIGGTVVI